jgi:acyl-CoA dehydrogenase
MDGCGLDAFRDAVRRFVDSEITPHQARWKQQHVDRELWNKGGANEIMKEIIARSL